MEQLLYIRMFYNLSCINILTGKTQHAWNCGSHPGELLLDIQELIMKYKLDLPLTCWVHRLRGKDELRQSHNGLQLLREKWQRMHPLETILTSSPTCSEYRVTGHSGLRICPCVIRSFVRLKSRWHTSSILDRKQQQTLFVIHCHRHCAERDKLVLLAPQSVCSQGILHMKFCYSSYEMLAHEYISP